MSQNKVDIVVKLGGSAVTEKTKIETAKVAEIKRAVNIIKKCRENNLKCIIVHGAGGFGHHQAKEYRVNDGWKDVGLCERTKVLEGFTKTRESVTKLNHLITSEFIAAEIPAVALAPFGAWITKNKKVIQDGVSIVTSVLGADLVPIMHGDGVLDQGLGCSILSGDTIIQIICEQLEPSRVIFLSDVSGVYDKPPNLPDAQLLAEVRVKSDGTIDFPVATSVLDCDVTGGIELKMESAITIVTKTQKHTPVFICDINSQAAFNACLYGDFKNELGTILAYDWGHG